MELSRKRSHEKISPDVIPPHGLLLIPEPILMIIFTYVIYHPETQPHVYSTTSNFRILRRVCHGFKAIVEAIEFKITGDVTLYTSSGSDGTVTLDADLPDVNLVVNTSLLTLNMEMGKSVVPYAREFPVSFEADEIYIIPREIIIDGPATFDAFGYLHDYGTFQLNPNYRNYNTTAFKNLKRLLKKNCTSMKTLTLGAVNSSRIGLLSPAVKKSYFDDLYFVTGLMAATFPNLDNLIVHELLSCKTNYIAQFKSLKTICINNLDIEDIRQIPTLVESLCGYGITYIELRKLPEGEAGSVDAMKFRAPRIPVQNLEVLDLGMRNFDCLECFSAYSFKKAIGKAVIKIRLRAKNTYRPQFFTRIREIFPTEDIYAYDHRCVMFPLEEYKGDN